MNNDKEVQNLQEMVARWMRRCEKLEAELASLKEGVPECEACGKEGCCTFVAVCPACGKEAGLVPASSYLRSLEDTATKDVTTLDAIETWGEQHTNADGDTITGSASEFEDLFNLEQYKGATGQELLDRVSRYVRRRDKEEVKAFKYVTKQMLRLVDIEEAARTFVEYDGEADVPDYIHYQTHFDALKATLDWEENPDD